MQLNHVLSKHLKNLLCVSLSVLLLTACAEQTQTINGVVIKTDKPLVINYEVTGSLVKKINLDVDNPANYANISVLAQDRLLLDRLNIPTSGRQELNALVRFDKQGDIELTLKSNNADLKINSLRFEDVDNLTIPSYQDISEKSGLEKVSSLKYAGPTIADIDNDGDYDFIVNNHNDESSKLYWNNGDGTVTKHKKNLARWFMHDLHGTAAGDYDNDGDLDIVVTQGGGNGKDPSKANFYQNNNGTLVLSTGDVGINRGGRGRGALWSDMDLDGDLDLILINETSLHGSKPQHFFHENLGDGTFKHRAIEGLQDQTPSRALITDINQDNIDDIILYGPLSVWQGNGDFTFTDVSSQFPNELLQHHDIMAMVDIDIDNDGDLDLYLARGKEFENGRGEAPSVDHDPIAKEFSIKPRGYKGLDEFEFTADGAIKLHKYYYLAQGAFRGKDYPIFLGSEKSPNIVASGEEFIIDPDKARGRPKYISENGAYFWYLGDGRWNAALVRNSDIFWAYKFSLSGVKDVTLGFEPENRNIADILLRNDGGKFVDVSQEWNIPTGGNSSGVTTGDFNNDGHQDIFVYRWGEIGQRISDYMLLNNGKGEFQTVTTHGASDVGGPGYGDMGQAFDFDLDGHLDLLSGSEGGEWYLYKNAQGKQSSSTQGNYLLVNVGYSPEHNVDAISAEVIVKTELKKYRKRVSSAGSVFSQSLLNIVHFGLGNEEHIKSIQVRWRNGENTFFTDKPVNRLYDTDKADPITVHLEPSEVNIRKGTSIKLDPHFTPANSDKTLTWSSNNDEILSVDNHGLITAVGKVNEIATITASSQINGISTESQVSIVEWFPLPIKSLSIIDKEEKPLDQITLIAGQEENLRTNVQPKYPDDSRLVWTSSDSTIASVDTRGVIKALKPGDATITASSVVNTKINDEIQVQVKPLVKPYIKITNEDKLANTTFVAGESITLDVEYHAGSGNKVISSDEGGIRFWLRHFKSKWIPVKDIVLTDPKVLKTESGHSTKTISLNGLTPTAGLPDGHFYQLRASFASSDGNMYDATIYPINIVETD